MITLAKIILGIMLSLTVARSPKKDLVQNYVPVKSIYTVAEDSIQLRAFKILSNKCNGCHLKRNRRRVFSIEHMNPLANDVYKQVFIKKRIPSGKKIKLTNEDYQALVTWITSTKNQNNGI